MPTETQELFKILKSLLARAHAPYSGFRVAAAAIDESGSAHFGVNVENQSYPVGTCAEAGALSALLAGGGRQIIRLYLLSEPDIGVVPCGACRQRLAELGSPATVIVSFDAAGNETAFTLQDLFPHGFRFR